MAGARWQRRVRRRNGAVDRTWPVDPRWPLGRWAVGCRLSRFPEETVGRSLQKGPAGCRSQPPGPSIVLRNARGDGRRCGVYKYTSQGGRARQERNPETRSGQTPRARGPRPHPTADAPMPPRSRSIAAARATSRPIPKTTPPSPPACCVRLACACVHAWRGVRSGEARRLCVRRTCVSLPIRVRPGVGEVNEAQGPTTHITTNTTPPRARTCTRRPTSNDRVHLPGVGPTRLSRPVARAPRHRTSRGREERRSAVNCNQHHHHLDHRYRLIALDRKIVTWHGES